MLRARRYSRTGGRGCPRIVACGGADEAARALVAADSIGSAPVKFLYRGFACRKSGLRHFFEVFIAPLRLRRGQGAMQGNPCYARLFADLTRMSPNPIKASGGCGPRTPGGFFDSLGPGKVPLPGLRSFRRGSSPEKAPLGSPARLQAPSQRLAVATTFFRAVDGAWLG